jgi:hypothetical protein
MKKVVSILMIFFIFMPYTSAETHQGVHPRLRFDHVAGQILQQDNHAYLRVIPEEVVFPENSQKARFDRALLLLEEILNSDEFRIKVISYVRSNGKREYANNVLWNDTRKRLSNEAIFNIIMTGNELMVPNTEGEMNLSITLRTCKRHERLSPWCRTVVGSTTPYSSQWIELNWRFYSHMDTAEMVSNIVHEWLHLIGFLHAKNDLHEDVPYVVGAIAGEIARQRIGAN